MQKPPPHPLVGQRPGWGALAPHLFLRLGGDGAAAAALQKGGRPIREIRLDGAGAGCYAFVTCGAAAEREERA